jgi:hypothetical protein
MGSEKITGCTLALLTDTLSAWRDGALPPADSEQVDAHLPTCAACRARLAEYDAVAHALRLLAVPEPVGGYGRNPRRWHLGSAADSERPDVHALPRVMGPARSGDGVRPRLRTAVEVVAALLLVSLLGGLLGWQRHGGSGTAPTPTAITGPAPSAHVFRTNRDVPEGDLTPTTVSCPAGDLALSGGWTIADHGTAYQQTVLQSARSLDGKGWSVLVENTDPTPATVGAYVICLRSAPLGTKVFERSQTITVPAGQTGSATATCQSGELAVGGGFGGLALQIMQMGSSGDVTREVSADNPTGSDAPLTAYVECLIALVGAHLSVQSDLPGVQVPPHSANPIDDVVVQCPTGSVIAGGGFSVVPGNAAVFEVYPDYYSAQYDYPDYWVVRVYNPSATVQTLTGVATCLSFATRPDSAPTATPAPTLDPTTQAYVHVLRTDYLPFVDAEQQEYDRCDKVPASQPLAPCRPLEVAASTAGQTLLAHLTTTPPPAGWQARDTALKQAVQEAVAYNLHRIQAIDANNTIQFQLTRSDGNAAASLLCTTILQIDNGPPPLSPSIVVPSYAMDPQGPGCLPA